MAETQGGGHGQREDNVKPHRAEPRDNNAEIGAMHLQTQNHQGLMATPEPQRKARNRFSPAAFRESMTLPTT